MNIKQVLILLLLLSSALTLSLAVVILRKRKVSGSLAYAMMMFSISLYSLGSAMELHSTTLSAIMLSIKLQYMGISYVSGLWFLLAARYTGIMQSRRLRHYILIFIIPFITQVLVFSNEYHFLYYINPRIVDNSPFINIRFERAPWYYVQMVYTNIMILAGNFMFGRLIFKSTGKHRIQAVMAFSASLIPWVGNILYVTGKTPYGLDLTALFFTVTGPIFAVALFYYRMFDLSPIARSRIFELVRDPLIVLDNEDRLVDLNHSAALFLNVPGSKPIGERAEALFKNFPEIREQIVSHSEESCDIQTCVTSGCRYYRSSLSRVVDASGMIQGKILILNDTTSEQLLIRKLNEIATVDALTGISNRRNLMDLCSQELERSVRDGLDTALMVLDLDFFKKVNDLYGHQCGDETLKQTALVFQNNLRTGDILGRYGGEEFVIMLHNTAREDALNIAERFRKSLQNQTIRFQDSELKITVSIGLSVCSSQEKRSLDCLINEADEALYLAKKNGRNRVELFTHPWTACR